MQRTILIFATVALVGCSSGSYRTPGLPYGWNGWNGWYGWNHTHVDGPRRVWMYSTEFSRWDAVHVYVSPTANNQGLGIGGVRPWLRESHK